MDFAGGVLGFFAALLDLLGCLSDCLFVFCGAGSYLFECLGEVSASALRIFASKF